MYDVSPIKKNGEFHWFSMIFHISSVWFGVFFLVLWICELTDPSLFGSSISESATVEVASCPPVFRFSKTFFFFDGVFHLFLAQNAHTFQVMVVFLHSNSRCKIDRRVVFFHPKRLICNKSIHVTTLNVDVSIPNGWGLLIMAGQLDLPEESSSKREAFQAPKAPTVQQF